jgi:hypothetical protein
MPLVLDAPAQARLKATGHPEREDCSRREFSTCKPKHKSFWGAFFQKGAMVL